MLTFPQPQPDKPRPDLIHFTNVTQLLRLTLPSLVRTREWRKCQVSAQTLAEAGQRSGLYKSSVSYVSFLFNKQLWRQQLTSSFAREDFSVVRLNLQDALLFVDMNCKNVTSDGKIPIVSCGDLLENFVKSRPPRLTPRPQTH